MADDKAKAEYYMLDVGQLPDELYSEEVPVQEWQKRCVSADSKGFPKGSLALESPCPTHVHLERLVGIPLYLFMNMAPFVLPVVALMPLMGYWLLPKLLFAYLAVLLLCELVYMQLFPQKALNSKKAKQYAWTERNTQKYLSMRWLWPKSLHYPACKDTPLIYCLVPHGVGPMGLVAYPLFSKLFNDNLNHPTAAPVVLKIPIVGWFIKQLQYIPAKSSSMKDCLSKKGENVSVILDGIAGMFQQDEQVEKLWLQDRKGICKISLQTGCPIVPAYGFGHTSLWTVLDLFGILEKISTVLNVSICPFYGRFGWPIGPPRRVPVTVAFGDPITCEVIADPTDAQINAHHAKMIEGFRVVFEKHKDAYGWSHKTVKFI